MDEQNNMCWTRTNKQPCRTFWTHLLHCTQNPSNLLLYKIKARKTFAVNTIRYRLQGLKQYSPMHTQQWHQRDYLGAQRCPFPICRCISHVRSFSSSRHPRILFSISSIVTVDWCYISAPPPPGKHTEELNNFSIYMHGGTRYHSNTLGHLRKCTAAPPQQQQQHSGLGFTLAASLSAPRQLVISVRIMREKFKMLPHSSTGFPFRIWLLETVFFKKTPRRWGKNSNI